MPWRGFCSEPIGQRAVVGHPGPQPRRDHLGVGFRHQRAEAYDDPARPSVGPTRLHGGMHPRPLRQCSTLPRQPVETITLSSAPRCPPSTA
ncbi:hypothetical protein ACWDBD_48485 [Streptomyces sp. NPDC001118]